jgi:hypothetical protein
MKPTERFPHCDPPDRTGIPWQANAEPDPDETLAALGLPPNRKGGQLGFIVQETDGKLHAPTVGSDGHAEAGQFASH